jgi:hypothetical protein
VRWLVVVCLLVTSSPVGAHGSDPVPISIYFRQGNEQHIAASTTFGLILSDDGGVTWHWMCEAAGSYGGNFIPDYVYAASGALFATSFEGVKVRRPADPCTFGVTPAGTTFVSRIAGGPDGAFYYSASATDDAKIYKSTDDGQSFPTSASAGQNGDWWSSLRVAPSNAQRVYLTGYRFEGVTKVFLLFTSDNGGASYTPMTTTGISPTSSSSTIEIVGVDAQDDRIVYAKVTFENGEVGDSVYRSIDAGQSWMKILTRTSVYGLSFLARRDGTCVASTRELGSWRSTDCASATAPVWNGLSGAPHIGCLAEDSTGAVWACTQNFLGNVPPPLPPVQPDGYAIMRATGELSTWTPVLKLQDIAGPVACPAGTIQHDDCTQSQWCCLVQQLQITSTAIDCSMAGSCAVAIADGTPDAGPKMPGPDPSCCGAGRGTSSLLFALFVVAKLCVRRRRRAR